MQFEHEGVCTGDWELGILGGSSDAAGNEAVVEATGNAETCGTGGGGLSARPGIENLS
jgi:hypothetical protein